MSTLLLLATLCLLPTGLLQDARDAPPAPAGTETQDELPPVEAPPEIKASIAAKLEREITKLKNDKDKYRLAAEKKILAMGRGAIPALMDAATSGNPSQQIGLVNCLSALADLRDREIVAEALGSELVVLRRFAARKSGDYGIDAITDRLPPLLEDEDDIVATEAALSLVRLGREDGLRQAVLVFDTEWKERVVAALPGVAGKGRHEVVSALLRIDPRREREDPEGAAAERRSAVQLLHAIGDEASIGLIMRALDDGHNLVKIEAINALRDLVEGKGPMEGKSVFQQIKEIERLKGVVNAR